MYIIEIIICTQKVGPPLRFAQNIARNGLNYLFHDMALPSPQHFIFVYIQQNMYSPDGFLTLWKHILFQDATCYLWTLFSVRSI